MARPKKTSSDELVALVDSYFTSEACGNPSRFKCSLLEAFAAKNGYNAKAYDFRRDEGVRKRIEELKLLVSNENGIGFQFGAPYKNLDIDRIMRTRRDPDGLRKVLGELDTYWQHIYAVSVEIHREAGTLREENDKCSKEYAALLSENEKLKDDNRESTSETKRLTLENRYLRKMLRTYLYPALANEILVQEHLLKDADTTTTAQARKDLVDGEIPSSAREGTEGDRALLSREERILEQMWTAVPEEGL